MLKNQYIVRREDVNIQVTAVDLARTVHRACFYCHVVRPTFILYARWEYDPNEQQYRYVDLEEDLCHACYMDIPTMLLVGTLCTAMIQEGIDELVRCSQQHV